MLTPNAELMRQAREVLKGKWGLAVVGNLIFLVVTTAVNAVGQVVPMVGWVANLIIGGPLILGLSLFFLGLSRGQDVQYSRIFDGFQRFFDALITYLLMVLLIFLWSLLLVVPGIIAALSYGLTFFLMADRPELKGMDALKESQRLMTGNRWKLFCLFLRFIGWFLLGALTMGIAFLWVMPYLQTAAARFYDDVLGGGPAGGDGGTKIRPPVPPQPPQQPPRKAAPPVQAPQPAGPPPGAGPKPEPKPTAGPKPASGPKPAAGPAPETPKPTVNPRARLCLSCHSPITDPEAKACPKCGFAVIEVPGFTPKPTSPPPPAPPASAEAAPPAAPAPPVKAPAPPTPPAKPAAPSAAPQAASPPPVPPKPLDLEATVRVGPPRLTSTTPDGRPESFALRLPLNRIGRKNENDLSFPMDRTISGRHCEIYQEGRDWIIKDLASTNGVLVNGKKVETAKLQEGDQIKLGNKVFTLTRSA